MDQDNEAPERQNARDWRHRAQAMGMICVAVAFGLSSLRVATRFLLEQWTGMSIPLSIRAILLTFGLLLFLASDRRTFVRRLFCRPVLFCLPLILFLVGRFGLSVHAGEAITYKSFAWYDLAAAFAEIEPDEGAAKRLIRFRTLTNARPDSDETKMLLAEVLLATEDFPAARRALGDVPTRHPTQRALAILAALPDHIGGA